MTESSSQIESIEKQYSRRDSRATPNYGLMDQYSIRLIHERQLWLGRIFDVACTKPIEETSVLEIGCGSGTNLLEMIQFGFSPDHLVGNELLEHRYLSACTRLPKKTEMHLGDAVTIPLGDRGFDIVYQSTVFSSILSDGFQTTLANRMWELVNPGGFILWYDFIFNNPRNPDVRGVPVARIRDLFPDGEFHFKRVTLAPPLGRAVCRIQPKLYSAFNLFSFLRSHVLCWIVKPIATRPE